MTLSGGEAELALLILPGRSAKIPKTHEPYLDLGPLDLTRRH
jgi:hypothetical protein